jgi:hypothetical protein
MTEPRKIPGLIAITGVDGCGKTTLTHWLAEQLSKSGYETRIVWSRFNNYLSKPLLALTRLTGHNRRLTIDGVPFGFHDFETLHWYKHLFVFLQGVDVNIATWWRISRVHGRPGGILICERGPWDTLVDVVADTGLTNLPVSRLGRWYVRGMVTREARTILVRRSLDKILSSRPSLKHDYKLGLRINEYERLAALYNWVVIDNNGTLDEAKAQLLRAVNKTSI